MTVYKITTPLGRNYYTDRAAHLAVAIPGCRVDVETMDPDDYLAIPLDPSPHLSFLRSPERGPQPKPQPKN